MKILLKESDWLASFPFFYAPDLGSCGTSIWDAIGGSDAPEFHPEGLYNFLDYGYSVFEQTPLDGVRFLRHSSRLWRTDSGSLEIEHLDDPFDQSPQRSLSEADVVDLIQSRVRAWEDSLPSDQEIVLPLSGGFDSRLLLWCIRDKARVRAYTYGLSRDQSRSAEVVHARALAEHFGVRWEQVELGDFHRYFEDWDAQFGLSTHAHGMYHFEFYTRIREKLDGTHAFLSGIVGDVWAGSVPFQAIHDPQQLQLLGYTHGIRADPARLLWPVDHTLRDAFWVDNRERLRDHRFQTLTTIRLKLMLLSYLFRVPRLFDLIPWSPFLEPDVAMAMLNLPQKRRENRQWQRDFFRKVGLNLEDWDLPSSSQNELNFEALRRRPLRPLRDDVLGQLVDPDYIQWINAQARTTRLSGFSRTLGGLPKLGRIVRALGISDRILAAYSAYLCLRPIESMLSRGSLRRIP